MSIRSFLNTMLLTLTLCIPSVALSEEVGSGADKMKGSVSFGYNKVEDANSYTLEIDFMNEPVFFGMGMFLIGNGNLPSGLVDNPPPAGVNTVDVGAFDDNETGAYLKVGATKSGFRVFGMLGGSSVDTKYVVKSTLSGRHYVIEEETGDIFGLYGAGIGYLLFKKVLVQYQYDNRRKNLIMVGIAF
jgi:hypothetical protein